MTLNSNVKLKKWELASVTSQTSSVWISLWMMQKLLQQTLWHVKACQKSLWHFKYSCSQYSESNKFCPWSLKIFLAQLTSDGCISFPLLSVLFAQNNQYFSRTLRVFHVLLMDIQYLKCALKCQKSVWLLQPRMAQICEVNENWQTIFLDQYCKWKK